MTTCPRCKAYGYRYVNAPNSEGGPHWACILCGYLKELAEPDLTPTPRHWGAYEPISKYGKQLPDDDTVAWPK